MRVEKMMLKCLCCGLEMARQAKLTKHGKLRNRLSAAPTLGIASGNFVKTRLIRR